MFARRGIVKALAAFVGVVVLGWTATASSGILVGGPTSGTWNLPEGGQNGSAAGVLFDDTLNPVFTLGATLVETGGRRGTREGSLAGSLKDAGGNTAYDVLGTWTANKKGRGSFEAFIGFAGPGGVFAVVGQMSGTFRRGSYSGNWGIEIF